jgi:hypothetical protein
MNFQPLCRICGVCGLSLAVLVGEEHEHIHLETQIRSTFWQAENVYIAGTSSAVNVSTVVMPSPLRPPSA